PLGSCTMKYNPKVNEDVARMDKLVDIHPYQEDSDVQGSLSLLWEARNYLLEITGMDEMTFQPAAGAHGELTGTLIARKYFEVKGEKRTTIVVPDSAHGTNPASAAMAGFKVIEVKSDKDGCVDIQELKRVVNEDVAMLMLTNPNTLGLFELHIEEMADIIHSVGGLLYYDGANLNAIMGVSRPGDMQFDIVHLNLHKTFSTPHGGGGPGGGAICVKDFLKDYLPSPLLAEKEGRYYWRYDVPHTIGRIRAFYGQYNVVLKALAYIKRMGPEGLRQASQLAVLNANYLKEKLKKYYELPYDRVCKHEFVLSGERHKENYGVSTLDIAKMLLDYGVHPPTIYFPLIVHEAIMIEPNETETKETLDRFVDIMREIDEISRKEPERVQNAPYNTPVRRLDNVKAAREPVLKWKG
ncbi:MAG: aminomethyl-transferring glycine dehydrogenase subunit GcvPB, partial [Synergistetes bacterium]|nr:aminomethyl-transferring glycine dehydrogenase subunit GcvPB [Synergistota bacterium]